jgi:hypothetical protein
MNLTKGNGQGADNTLTAKRLSKTQCADTGTNGSSSKAISTQVALLAIKGHQVHRLADGGFLVSKYGFTYLAENFEALQAFAKRLGVSNG